MSIHKVVKPPSVLGVAESLVKEKNFIHPIKH